MKHISAILLLLSSCITTLWGQSLIQEKPNTIYSEPASNLLWYGSDSSYAQKRDIIRELLSTCNTHALNPDSYTLPAEQIPNDLGDADRAFTLTTLRLLTDMYEGIGIKSLIRHDELSPSLEPNLHAQLVERLSLATDNTLLTQLVQHILPDNTEYKLLQNAYLAQSGSPDSAYTHALADAMNLNRWIHHFQLSDYMVVNIAASELTYYRNDSEILRMQVITGKPRTRTPRFTTWCDKVIFYPYWYVPKSIIAKELLPQFKKNPGKVDEMNMQVLTQNGTVIDHHKLKWSLYNAGNFPYQIRQCTGCDNSLGVVKFNLTDPFGVYMHDTNHRDAFDTDRRYLSHGCIRLSKPYELANILLNNTVDTAFLESCRKNQQPIEEKLKLPVPVFVIYATVGARNDSLIQYHDIYHLYKK